jgi:hypothetical protein
MGRESSERAVTNSRVHFASIMPVSGSCRVTGNPEHSRLSPPCPERRPATRSLRVCRGPVPALGLAVEVSPTLGLFAAISGSTRDPAVTA